MVPTFNPEAVSKTLPTRRFPTTAVYPPTPAVVAQVVVIVEKMSRMQGLEVKLYMLASILSASSPHTIDGKVPPAF